MTLVPDVSAILSQVLDDEDATYAEAVIEAIAADDALVPTLFWFEIRNALLTAERRKRLTAKATTAFLADLSLLPIEVDDLPRESAVFDLARRHRLTIYDAAYLELAQRTGLALARVDRALMAVANAAGVGLFRSSRN